MDNNKVPIRSDDILYSNEKRMNSIWKIFTMDDKGKLDIYENRFRFIGEKYELQIRNVKNIFITRPTPSYGAHIVSEIICILVIWYTFLILYSSIEYFLTFFTIIIILYPVSLFLTRSDWIGLEYKDHGKIEKAFFSDGALPEGSVLSSKDTIKGSKSLFEKFQMINIHENKLNIS